MANLLNIFRDLTPADPALIGTVLSHTADGYSMIEMPGGGVIKAKGVSIEVSKKVFVQAGEVRGEAPDLHYFEITV